MFIMLHQCLKMTDISLIFPCLRGRWPSVQKWFVALNFAFIVRSAHNDENSNLNDSILLQYIKINLRTVVKQHMKKEVISTLERCKYCNENIVEKTKSLKLGLSVNKVPSACQKITFYTVKSFCWKFISFSFSFSLVLTKRTEFFNISI